jgi:hypothetical protein
MFYYNIDRTYVLERAVGMMMNKSKKNRFGISVFFLLIMVVFFSFMGLKVAKGRQPVEYSEVIVKKGDSLWLIAREYYPKKQDIRKSIWEIREINNLDDASIKPGQVLKIPVK